MSVSPRADDPALCPVCKTEQLTFRKYGRTMLSSHGSPGIMCPGTHQTVNMQPHKWGACSPDPSAPLCSACKRRHHTVTNYVKAAWRLKRVQTDPTMAVLIDALTTSAVVPAAEIADASDGRIIIENAQPQAELIAVAWGTRLGDRQRNATREAACQYIASSRVSAWRWHPGTWDPSKMGIGIDETLVSRELELRIDDMTVEFTGMIERVIVYNTRGNAEIELRLADVVYPSVGMTFRPIIEEEGDFIRLSGRTSYHAPERLLGAIVRRESTIDRGRARPSFERRYPTEQGEWWLDTDVGVPYASILESGTTKKG